MPIESWPERSATDVPVAEPRPRSARTELALALGVLVSLVAATLPLVRVVSPGGWMLGAMTVAAVVLAAGFGVRRLRLPAVVVALVELVVWALAMTSAFGGATALLGVVPTLATVELVPALVASAADEITLGAAPLDAGMALSFVIVGSVGLLAVVADHVVITARMPLLAAVALVTVSLIPALAVPTSLDVGAFLLLAVGLLFLLRTDARERQRSGDAEGAGGGAPPAATFGGASATALGIGVVAVIVAAVVTPLLPAPTARTGANGLPGTGTRIDPTLQLGDDLRRPREVEVLNVRSTLSSPPYLRVATLSRFDGAVWSPDEGQTVAIEDVGALPAPVTDADITVSEYRTTVEVLDLDSRWLPVPYPAVGVTGLDGAWQAMPGNNTVLTSDGSTRDQVYEVTTALPRPTLEQIRGRTASGADAAALSLPDDMPEIIAETAREVTAGSATDYDALLALQAWFRGPAFTYSLDAPVEEGFDGSGADAVADFLDRRAGYCVHFASAFALMARSLDMPARIVVGYLPGRSTSTQTDGLTVYTVRSGQLHSWPEVYFDGIGWVPFEPTKSLGVPTSFSSGSSTGSTTPTTASTAAPVSPTSAATPTPTASPSASADAGAEAGGSPDRTAPSPALGVGMLVLLALAAPSVLGGVRRRRLRVAAGDGEPTAAWAAVQEYAIDLGVPVPAAESPRAFGARLVTAHDAPADAVGTLVRAIERASYSDDPARRHTAFGDGAAYAEAVGAIVGALRDGASPWRRLRAVLAPRSLFVRPGSAYAASTGARSAR